MMLTSSRGTLAATLVAGTLAITAATMAMSPHADAGKGGKNTTTRTAAIVLDQGAPALGDLITFSTIYPNTARNPRIQVVCVQNGATTYGEAGSASGAFVLGGGWSLWLQNGGSASCQADLFDLSSTGDNQQATWYASTTFTAAG